MSCKFSFLINFAGCIANTVLMMGLVFDRMFQLKIVHSANPGTEKVHYLCLFNDTTGLTHLMDTVLALDFYDLISHISRIWRPFLSLFFSVFSWSLYIYFLTTCPCIRFISVFCCYLNQGNITNDVHYVHLKLYIVTIMLSKITKFIYKRLKMRIEKMGRTVD